MEEKEFDERLSAMRERVLSKKLNTDKEVEDTNYAESLFESIRHINEHGAEFWCARELQLALEYKRWDKFTNVIEKAELACQNSKNTVSDHFSHVGKMVNIGSGAEREIDDIELSRYACYLIVQNGDPHKKIIALGQSYFAVKTRQQELIENYDTLNEDNKRLAIRNEMKMHNKSLTEAAKQAGVSEPIDYAIFQNRGYQGLYGGLTKNDIHKRKGLEINQDILDHMGSTELAANLFRATQTEEKLRKENVFGKDAANKTHYEVGKKVRETIQDLSGTMPENLPTPDKSIKQIERERKKNSAKLSSAN